MGRLEINVLRGEENIGENLIEISDGKTKILIECGIALNPSDKSREIENKVLSTYYDGIIISHSHLDHAGLLKNEVNTETIYMGKSTYELLMYQDTICKENRHRVAFFDDNTSFFVGEIEVCAYLCDHSAYDSYMIEIKKGEERILYTGDFRSNGRKSFKSLLNKLPKKVDVLITEATNPGLHNYTERYLEKKAHEIMKKHKRVFFLQSRFNIDRLVSFYRATRRAGKPFIMGLCSAELSRIGKNIPSPLGFDDCYTYFRHRVNNFEYTSSKDRYKQRLIGRREIAELEAYSMQVMSGMGDYLERLAELSDLKGGALIYSMWQGYKETDSVKIFLEKARELGLEVYDLHVSGHADKVTQKRLIDQVKPDKIITVHTEKNQKCLLENTTVINVETDGLNCDDGSGEVDRIIKIEAIKIENGEIGETFSTFVRSDRAIRPEIEVATGIKNEDLEGAPSLNDALINLYIFAYDSQIAVHYAPFAIGFLNYYLKFFELGFYDFTDIYELARERLKGKIKRFRVSDILKHFDAWDERDENKAKNDALALIFLENMRKV